MKTRLFRRASALISAIVLLVSGVSISPAAANGSAVPNKVIDESTVGIQMFMYSWNSIKDECTNHLGPNGIDWVQISPPQEHIRGEQWWVHYQPVSYKIESRLGTRAEFAAMTQACNEAGVMIIADAVINHMANSSGIGWADTEFDKYGYPGLYGESDFHATMDPSEDRFCDSNIEAYDDLWETTSCMLGGLPDLATEKPSVRVKIADYLNDLISLGVAGFRVDAAKHFGAADLKAVVDLLDPINGRQPIIMSEVIGGNGQNEPFTEFGYAWAWDMPNILLSNLNQNTLAFAKNDFWTVGFNASNKTITMVSNHDTEHHGPSSLAYWETQKYQLAHVFMLSAKFGIPQIYSGYSFSDERLGPNTNPDTQKVVQAKCASSTKPVNIIREGLYNCIQRWRSTSGMVAWRDVAGSAPETKVGYSKHADGAKILKFNRGANTFIAMNSTQRARKMGILTNLPAGTYCDLLTGGRGAVVSSTSCLGTKVVVDARGKAVVTIPAMLGIALTTSHKLP